MTLHAMLRSPDGETKRISADGQYETAKAAIEAQVPDGWTLLWLSQW